MGSLEGKRMKRALCVFVFALCSVGCGSLDVLQAVVDSTAAAVPILQAAGVPIPPEVPTYISAVANCIGSQTGSPTSTQLAAISGCLARQVAPTLPAGIPQAIANIISLVSQDVIRYLQAHPAPVVAVPATVARQTVSNPLGSRDTAKVEAMRIKAQATVVALKPLVKK